MVILQIVLLIIFIFQKIRVCVKKLLRKDLQILKFKKEIKNDIQLLNEIKKNELLFILKNVKFVSLLKYLIF